eukprot:CAMPEP_0185186016 /NCGR_PEP_ID=MMETSP1140-20130426/3734_1 /TAXON_ID=298111 /ORGANISM="Pavlova sp., Strain CCMP459" /LENGTH=514 /DNA_ID=CAMNT_0027752267 /DNA_START=21 /DNA_END=1565 /DNA_ORIENTATION=-
MFPGARRALVLVALAALSRASADASHDASVPSVRGGLCAGIDCGTSGVRVAVLGSTGLLKSVPVQCFSAAQPLAEDAGPGEWVAAVEGLLLQVPPHLRRRLTKVAVCGTSGTVLLTERVASPGGAARKVLRGPRRYDKSVLKLPGGKRAVDAICRRSPAGHVVRSPSSSLAKLMAWHYEKPITKKEVLAHHSDYVTAHLRGPRAPLVSDWHNSLKLGYDVSPGALRYPDWMKQLMREGGGAKASFKALPPSALPRVVKPGQRLGRVHARLADHLGVPRTCVVCAGTTDSIAAFFAATAGHPTVGTAVTSLGSTLALKVLSRVRVDDEQRGLYSHRLGRQLWLVGGASNGGPAVLREHFSDERISELSRDIDPDEDCDLGYVMLRKGQLGERLPTPDPAASQRLTPRPRSDARFLHGMLDALARMEAQAYTALVDAGADSPRLVLSCGGGASNPTLSRMRTRLLGVEARCADWTQASTGVALLAACEGRVPVITRSSAHQPLNAQRAGSEREPSA